MMNFRELVQSYAKGARSPLRVEARRMSTSEGEVLVYGPIVDLPWFEDETSAFQLRKAIDSLGDIETLHVRVNSPGGFLDQGIAMHNTLKQTKAHVIGWVDGLAASAASIVLAAADEIRMPKNARIMIHDPWSMTVGDAEDHLKSAEILEDGKQQAIESYFARPLTVSREDVAQMMTDETWITAEQAVDMGFADIVVGEEAPPKAMNWDLRPFNYRRAPIASVVDAGDPVPVTPSLTEEDDVKPEEVTVDWLRQNRPEVFEEIKTEVQDAAKADGAKAERDRIRDVESASLPGHEALVSQAKFDGVSTGPQVAMRIVEAERKRRDELRQQIRSGGGVPEPVVVDPAPAPTRTDYNQIADLTERAKAMWEDEAEYDGRKASSWESLERFTAYVKAHATGRVRVLNKQR